MAASHSSPRVGDGACVALMGLDGTLALTGAMALAYGAIAFARPALAPLPSSSLA
ncbi:MAG: hypothetical protein ACXVFM_22225 [Solirubrobacteraceae bacterium]